MITYIINYYGFITINNKNKKLINLNHYTLHNSLFQHVILRYL